MRRSTTVEPPCGSMDDNDLGRKPALVRTDEAVIVFLVLCFWMAVIALFCNKWGKIRHLEPYQPQYHAEEPTPFPSPVYSIHPKPTRSNTYRTSAQLPGQFSMTAQSRLNMNAISLDGRRRTYSQGSRLCATGCSIGGQKPLFHCASACVYQHHSPTQRRRMNSLFAGCSHHNHRHSLQPEPTLTRKIKSAEDIKTLFVQMTSKSNSPQHTSRNQQRIYHTPSFNDQYQHHPPRHPNTITIDESIGPTSLDQSETMPILRDVRQMTDSLATTSQSIDLYTVDQMVARCSKDNLV